MSGSDPDRRHHRSLLEDERAIEGLPIRLVIALVVGVAALGIMMNVLGTFDFGANQEVTTAYDDGVIADGGSVVVTVRETATDAPVAGATVVPATGESTRLDGAAERTTDESGQATFELGDGEDAVSIDWGPTQDVAELRFDVEPRDDDLVDEEPNPELVVRRS